MLLLINEIPGIFSDGKMIQKAFRYLLVTVP